MNAAATATPRQVDWFAKFAGTLLGTAVGDSLGLPREGLSARRARQFFGTEPIGHQFLGRRGMISDDTEHTCMVAQALLASGGDENRFVASLAWRLRGWLLAVPAGVGLATLRAILKLWVGFGPAHSGVWSAGNGPAMRSAVIGVWAAAHGISDEALGRLVAAATRLTHTDPRAFEGAMVVAMAAGEAARHGADGLSSDLFWVSILNQVKGDELHQRLQAAQNMAAKGNSLAEYRDAMGWNRGISGYVNQTVPAAIFCCVRYGSDFRAAVEAAVAAGGDTDTLAAIVGGICGSACGPDAMPREWMDGIWEWPRSIGWMQRLANQLAHDNKGAVPLFWPGLVPRNAAFLAVVLLHGLRRLLPPY